jgi:AAA+ superfamily predicted ATPase
MDNFNGILICCTNLKQALDSAVFRRFHLKIEFKPVLKDQRVALYKKYFVKGKKALTEDQMVKIEAMDNLTPGDIYAVSLKTRFIDPRKLTHDAIILELENELKQKPENARVLGF